jgi:hypothetical protein
VREPIIAAAPMVDPDGRIREDDHRGRRRRAGALA